MAFRKWQPFTILIAATGKAPVTLTIRPLPMVLGLAIALGLPIVWIGALFYHNSQLAQRNETLTETANEVLTELNTLDAEIEVLKDRAGLPDSGLIGPPTDPERVPQGGPARVAAPEAVFDRVRKELPDLSSTLKTSVKPALEEVLDAEAKEQAAFPDGKPLVGYLKVSSEFGLRPNPFGGRNYELHEGIDFSGPVGKPVLATAEGVVVRADYNGGFGKHVRLDHGYSYETIYAHLSDIAVEPGDRVKRGEVVGYLGNTGRSSGPHLHYGVYRNGRAINPRYYLKLEEPK